MINKGCLLLLVSMLLAGCGSDDDSSLPSAPDQNPVSARSYYMGFTPFPYEISQSAIDNVYDAIAADADVIAHHFDNGIPWNDALVDAYPYDSNIMDDWDQRAAKTPAGHKVYVAITPIAISRDVLAPLRDTADDMPLLAPFDMHAANGDFNHNDVKTAYLNYSKRVINYFSPDYLAIGIEVNLLRKETDAATWTKYRELNDYIYSNLKVLYPDLVIFASVSVVEMVEGYTVGLPAEFSGDAAGYEASQLAALQDVLISSDYYAVSLYPFLSAYHDTAYPGDFLDTLFSLSSKPLAIAETGMIAESQSAFGIDLIGSPGMQDEYLRELLHTLDARNAEFINWFIIQDYDSLCVAISCDETSSLWRDTGLYDGFGNVRPAHATWMEWRTRELN